MVLRWLDFGGFCESSFLMGSKGELMKRSSQGFLFITAAAISTVFASAAQAGGPFQYYAVTPCRIADTRSTSRVTNAAFVNFTVKGGTCGVPSDAAAATLNLTVVNPAGSTAGYLSVWPYGGTPPNVSTMNYASGEPALANGAIVPLAAGTPDITVGIGPCTPSCPSSTSTYTLDLIIDVTGYFK